MKKIKGNSSVFYRPITIDDYRLFYSDTILPKSIRGLSFFVNDVISGVAGVEYNGSYFRVFSEVKDGTIVPPSTIWRVTVIVMCMVDDMKCDVYAFPDPNIERAPIFLKRLGFIDIGGIYKRATK